MTRRRRAAVLLGLALVLGTLSATHMARREAALEAQLGPVIEVVVARKDLPRGARSSSPTSASARCPRATRRRASRRSPPRWRATSSRCRSSRAAPVTAELLVRRPQTPESAIERGQRAVDVVATGSPQAVIAGARVDVLVTTERRDRTRGTTRIALENVEVLAARAPPPEDAEAKGAPRVAATLRVTAAQAVYLAAAQSFARDVRLLARAPGDRRTVGDARRRRRAVRGCFTFVRTGRTNVRHPPVI